MTFSFRFPPFFYHSLGDGFMGLILGVGVPLPASRGDWILRSITSKAGLWYSFFSFCAASTGGDCFDFVIIVKFKKYKNGFAILEKIFIVFQSKISYRVDVL